MLGNKNLIANMKQQLKNKEQDRINLIKQTTDFLIDVPDQYNKPVSYVMAQNGAFSVRNTGMADFVLPAEKIPGLKEIKPGMNLKIPKIPFNLICQCLAFFREIYTRDLSEASALIFWNPDTQQHFIHIPEQENTGSRSDFQQDEDTKRLRVEKVPVMEIHSHHSMDAFWSQTDNANENMAQCYMVFGKITTTPTYKVRYACAGNQIDINLWDIVEKPSITMNVAGKKYQLPVPEVLDKFPSVDFPQEWMEKSKKSVFIQTSMNYTGAGYNTTGYNTTGYNPNGYNNGQIGQGIRTFCSRQSNELKNPTERTWYVHSTAKNLDSDQKKIILP